MLFFVFAWADNGSLRFLLNFYLNALDFCLNDQDDIERGWESDQWGRESCRSKLKFIYVSKENLVFWDYDKLSVGENRRKNRRLFGKAIAKTDGLKKAIAKTDGLKKLGPPTLELEFEPKSCSHLPTAMSLVCRSLSLVT